MATRIPTAASGTPAASPDHALRGLLGFDCRYAEGGLDSPPRVVVMGDRLTWAIGSLQVTLD